MTVEVQAKTGDTYLISIVEIDGGKQPRSIPYLDDETATPVPSSQITHLRMCQSSAQSAYTGEILDMEISVEARSRPLTDMADVTYNEINDTANVAIGHPRPSSSQTD